LPLISHPSLSLLPGNYFISCFISLGSAGADTPPVGNPTPLSDRYSPRAPPDRHDVATLSVIPALPPIVAADLMPRLAKTLVTFERRLVA
jgi:hypothetical protein